MAQHQVSGIVIKEIRVGEQDKIIHILTDKAGIISASAKGAMRVKSRLVSSTALLCYSAFSLVPGKGDLYIIDDAKIIHQFYSLRTDVYHLALAVYFLELVRRLSPDETDLSGHLKLLLNTLHFLDNGERTPPFLKALFELRLLSMCGYMPDLVGCQNCGKFDGDIAFSAHNGNLLCANCMSGGGHGDYQPLTPSLLAAMRHIAYSDIGKLFHFQIDESTQSALQELTERYLVYQTDGPFKSLDYLKRL